jgi:hypothetical protein
VEIAGFGVVTQTFANFGMAYHFAGIP